MRETTENEVVRNDSHGKQQASRDATMLGQQRTPTSAFRRQAARQFVELRNVVRGLQPLLTISAEIMRGTKESSILRDDLHGKMQAARDAAMLGQSGCISSWADPPKKKSNWREQIRNLFIEIKLFAPKRSRRTSRHHGHHRRPIQERQ